MRCRARMGEEIVNTAATGKSAAELYAEYIEEVWHRKNLAAVERYFTPDFVSHSSPPDFGEGVPGLENMFGMFLNAFPDARIQIEDTATDGDKLVCRVNFSGTHEGPFFGIPGTGKSFSIGQIHWFRIQNGKMAEH